MDMKRESSNHMTGILGVAILFGVELMDIKKKIQHSASLKYISICNFMTVLGSL